MSPIWFLLCYITIAYSHAGENCGSDLSVVLVQALQGQLNTCMEQNAELIRRSCARENSSEPIDASSEEKKIAFHVGLSKNIVDLPHNQTVIFDRVHLNEGKMYDPRTGTITCTKEGIYVFHWTILTIAGKYFYTDFKVNGNIVGRSHPNGATVNRAASSTVVQKMVEGDRAWIEPHYTYVGQLAHHGWCFLSGYKI